jgi:hypothetical protein
MAKILGFKPKDHNDLTNFLADNHTVGSNIFFKNKFGDKFPDEYYQYFEAITRPEYTDDDVNSVINEIHISRQQQNEKLLKELQDRYNDNLNDPFVKMLNEIKNKVTLYEESK